MPIAREPFTSRVTCPGKVANQCLDEVVSSVEMGSAIAEATTRATAQSPRGIETLDPEATRGVPRLLVSPPSFRTQLSHIPEHQPAPARVVGEHFEPRPKRSRVGVVGIVDEHEAATKVSDLKPPRHRPHPGETGLHHLARAPHREGCGSRRERVHRTVAPRKTEPRLQASERTVHLDDATSAGRPPCATQVRFPRRDRK